MVQHQGEEKKRRAKPAAESRAPATTAGPRPEATAPVAPPPPTQRSDEELARRAAELESKLKEAQAALDDQKKRQLYLQAEFDNFRKQKLRESEELRMFAAERVVSTLLDDMENLQRLREHAAKEMKEAAAGGIDEKTAARFSSLYDGIDRVARHLAEALAATGLKDMEAQGAVFDPSLHEALAEESRPDCRDGEVLRVYQKGYTMHGRVLRPAKVLVGRRSAPAKKDEKPVEEAAVADPAGEVDHVQKTGEG